MLIVDRISLRNSLPVVKPKKEALLLFKYALTLPQTTHVPSTSPWTSSRRCWSSLAFYRVQKRQGDVERETTLGEGE
ncbi:hypothetical protein Y032_0348g3166 [Ancylostoma ceylanicum]|uniref:Uncharacterized protein n=1 Tax=Ancylostoma ceylanicum TaxID=53326 RepID=A0A016RX27_9BILA|nr:hypothetical protein Y032_0348g3166 [Ancylostoma ceylanicum]